MPESTTELKFSGAHFLTSAATLQQCPADEGAEVAFAGRSNAGKSSAINCLTDNRKLARTSKTPGRTQLINLFALTDQQRLVDLPGYGYARVPIKMKQEWQRNLSEYLQHRQSLRGLVLLMDVRHPLREYDTMMLNWALQREMPVHILLTKADKLKKGPAGATLLAIRQHLHEARADDLVSAQLFSSLNRTGLEELGERLQSWLSIT